MRYIIYFEPIDIDANSKEEAVKLLDFYRLQPSVSKILPAKYIFDYNEKEAPELSE